MNSSNTHSQEDRKRYRSSFASTVLFSGVQIYQIIIRIVKSKFVALFIGPAGMGIQSLLHSTTDTISAATNLGINTSSVKTISAANREGNKDLIARNISAQRRLIWITGLIGMFLCAVLAPIWSFTSFGNSDYIWAFVIISSVVLFDQLNRGELALLQGMQQKKKLARANVIGQTMNALITIPLYYFYGVKAIVAALVLGSFISLSISWYYSKQLGLEKIHMSWKETFSVGREMIKLGFFLSLQYLMQTLVIWIIRNYVSNVGGIDDVGLYSAGTAIVTSYIGLVFAAIATDYFPRLSATKDNQEMEEAVNTQADMMLLLLTPLVIAFLVFIKPVIIILYSDRFLPIENMMYWAIGAVLVQAMGWALSYTLLARAKPAVFFFNELIATAWGLPVKILCYKNWGLTGFGMSTMITYAIYWVQVWIITKKMFKISLSQPILLRFFFLHIPIVIVVCFKLFFNETVGYFTGSLVLLIVISLVILRLNKIMDLKSYLFNRKQKYNL